MAGGERRRSQLRTGIFFKCSFFGKASGSLTPKGVEERLDETFFFRESEARCSHSTASAKWEHPQLGAPGLPLLAGFPVSMVCVPLSGSSLAPPQPQAGPDLSMPPEIPSLGVLGDWGRRGAQHPSGTECPARRDGACWDSRWDAASPGMAPQGTTADSGELPLPPAAPKSWSWTPGSALGVVFHCFPPVVSTFYHNNQTAAF